MAESDLTTEEPSNPGALQMQTVPSVPVSGGAPALKTGEAEQDIVPNRWGAFVDTLKQASDSSPIGFMPGEPGTLLRGATQRIQEQADADRGVLKISPEEANKRYPGMPVPFNEPVDPYVADIQYSDFQHRQKLQAWKDRGEALPWGAETAAGVISGFADPLNIALGVATGGVSRAFGMASSLRNVFLQNLSINLATGIPSYMQEKAEHQDVTVGGAMANAVEGAVGGTAFHYATQAFASALSTGVNRGLEFIRRTPEDVQLKNTKTAVMQAETGSRVDVTPETIALASRMRGEIEGQQSSFRFVPVDHPSESSYFMAKEGQNGASIEFHNLGPGAYGVDNELVANHMASGVDGGPPGQVGKFVPPEEAKFLDLETSAKAPENAELVQSIEKQTGVMQVPEEGQTLKDYMQALDDRAAQGQAPADVLARVQEAAKEAGYSGYKYVEDHGTGSPQHNGVVMFDRNTQPSELVPVKPELAPAMPGSREQAFNSEQTDKVSANTYTPELDQEVREYRHGPSFNSTPEYLDPIIKEQTEAAQAQLKTYAEEDPSLKPELQELKRMEATTKQEKGIMSQFADCVVRNLS